MKNGRAFQVVEDLPTIKDRNRVVRELTADGWEVDPGGSKRYGYKVTAYKGERPYVIRRTFGIGTGQNDITPLYKREDGNGYEYMDGSPEYA